MAQPRVRGPARLLRGRRRHLTRSSGATSGAADASDSRRHDQRQAPNLVADRAEPVVGATNQGQALAPGAPTGGARPTTPLAPRRQIPPPWRRGARSRLAPRTRRPTQLAPWRHGAVGRQSKAGANNGTTDPGVMTKAPSIDRSAPEGARRREHWRTNEPARVAARRRRRHPTSPILAGATRAATTSTSTGSSTGCAGPQP